MSGSPGRSLGHSSTPGRRRRRRRSAFLAAAALGLGGFLAPPAPAGGGLVLVVVVLAALGLLQSFLVHFIRSTTIVACKHLGCNFNLGILRDKLWRNRHTFYDGNTGVGDRFVLHVAHRDEPVDLGHAQPVQRVGHQRLEPGVLDAGHVLGAVEVLLGPVAALLPLALVVHQVLCHLAESAALLAVVDDHARATGLRGLDALLDGVREVRTAGADVRPKDVRPVALVVHPHRERHGLVRDGLHAAPDVDRAAPDGRQEHAQVRAGDELGVHHVRVPEEALAKVVLGAPEPPRDLRQVPHRLDRRLGDEGLPLLVQDGAVGREASHPQRLLHLRQVNVRLSDGDGGADVIALAQVRVELRGHQVPKGVQRGDLRWVIPRGVRPNVYNWNSVFEIRLVFRVELAGGDRQRHVDAVAARVRADRVALRGVLRGRDHGPAPLGVRLPPLQLDGIRPKGAVMGGERHELHVILVIVVWSLQLCL
mmetsp:Transcript_34503/g.62946  ORF Transcript_34503/g.62946 Transcript_34503/m.62946 type:complete len:479 (-) Transcript_34503:89-1525(-)